MNRARRLGTWLPEDAVSDSAVRKLDDAPRGQTPRALLHRSSLGVNDRSPAARILRPRQRRAQRRAAQRPDSQLGVKYVGLPFFRPKPEFRPITVRERARRCAPIERAPQTRARGQRVLVGKTAHRPSRAQRRLPPLRRPEQASGHKPVAPPSCLRNPGTGQAGRTASSLKMCLARASVLAKSFSSSHADPIAALPCRAWVSWMDAMITFSQPKLRLAEECALRRAHRVLDGMRVAWLPCMVDIALRVGQLVLAQS